MLKSLSAVFVFGLVLALGCGQVEGQAGGRGESSLALGGGKVTVEYGRPSLQGRDLMALLPAGQEWRMGSNAATTLATDVGLKFGDTTVPKGRYVLKAKRVDADTWQLRVLGTDGSVAAEVPFVHSKTEASVESLTIELPSTKEGGQLVLKWGTHQLAATFQKA